MEDYVSFEQAKSLKDLGFNWKCYTFYHWDNWCGLSHSGICENHNMFEKCVSAPTLSQAAKWLREIKDFKLFINVKFHKGQVKYVWYIVTDNGERGICDDPEKSIFDTYEQALTAGIDRALELLKIN